MKWSVSDASEFKLCPRKFYYRKVLGWEPLETPKHLILGNQYDKMLETWDKEGCDKALEKVESLFTVAHDAEDAKVILKKYHETFKDDPLPPVENGNQHGFGILKGEIKTTGYLDKLSEKEISGVLQKVVVERKTTSEPIEENSAYWERLDLDPQIRCYVAYLKHRGWPCGWVCYEVIRKLSSTYHASLSKKYSIPIDQYRSLLAQLKLNKTLVARKWIYVSQEMVEEFEAEHVQTYQMFKVVMDNLPKEEALIERDFVKHEKSCNAFGECEFTGVCKKQCKIEDLGKFKKGEPRFPIA